MADNNLARDGFCFETEHVARERKNKVQIQEGCKTRTPAGHLPPGPDRDVSPERPDGPDISTYQPLKEPRHNRQRTVLAEVFLVVWVDFDRSAFENPRNPPLLNRNTVTCTHTAIVSIRRSP